MDEEDVVGCISCMSTTDLCDLFAVYAVNEETYAKLFETCFDIKVAPDLKYICSFCVDKLEKAAAFKDQTIKNISVLQTLKDEEYLDESLLDEEEESDSDNQINTSVKRAKKSRINVVESTCPHCEFQAPSTKMAEHLRDIHDMEPGSGDSLLECTLCGVTAKDLEDHMSRCHSAKSELEGRRYPCHFCDNVYVSKKACFTHLRMKHGYFMLFKSAIQEETKYRFRKTTASKQTIEGVRSHYMCSQSGVYVYQGKGKRPAPERQIYKTGKACPAHMIVTETMDRVIVTFYKTHVGHGPCPYFEPREPKRPKVESDSILDGSEMKTEEEMKKEDGFTCESGRADEWSICDACGVGFSDEGKFRAHVAQHGLAMFPCQYCDEDFQDLEGWSHHMRAEHDMNIIY
ncbi:hypothetical protein ACJJTC_002611 [Scirpophaga incertulas]